MLPVATPALLSWVGQWGAADIMEGPVAPRAYVSRPRSPFRTYLVTEK